MILYAAFAAGLKYRGKVHISVAYLDHSLFVVFDRHVFKMRTEYAIFMIYNEFARIDASGDSPIRIERHF
jgi:hypothetical protein